MYIKTYLSVFLLLLWRINFTNAYCDRFPFGHICRNMDLTGFCLQVSHILKIKNAESRTAPYQAFNRIFNRLLFQAEKVKGDKPFVHFGGYSRGHEWSCKKELEKCTPPPAPNAPPPPPPCTPAPPPAPACPPPPPPDCEAPTFDVPKCPEDYTMGPPDGTDTKDPNYYGCKPECHCCETIPEPDPAVGTIFSLQDGCELKYLKAPISEDGSTAKNPIKKDDTAKENPYRLDVTQIIVHEHTLHNWLHIRIYADKDDPGLGIGDLGKGRIKMAFIIVHDAAGFPVGEFDNTIPCDNSDAPMACNCVKGKEPKDPTCHQGVPEDTFPCMFDGTRVITNTGMMMVYSKYDGEGEGIDEIHASWKYSQSASPENFITELHFHALLVDEFKEIWMLAEDTASKNFRLSAISERHVKKKGIFGWNPVYDILHPTTETIGASDYFREDIYTEKDVKCHNPIDPKYYTVEPYPDSGETIKEISTPPEHCYRLNNIFLTPQEVVDMSISIDSIDYCFAAGTSGETRNTHSCPGRRTKVKPWFHDTYGMIYKDKVDPEQVYPWTLYGARTEAYVLRDGGKNLESWEYYNSNATSIKLYHGVEEINALPYEECATSDKDKFYGMAHQYKYPDRAEKYDGSEYGHFCRLDGYGRRVLNLPLPVTDWPNQLATIWKFPAVNPESFIDDRCFCPSLPPTPDPRYKEPPEVQVQGRRQHAYQMIIGWNCIVPFAIFVSRYYKETYSKVFFLQEYWWYTIHVLCMVSAAMFTFGGIYVMELKRRDPINWFDIHITMHISVGFVVISVFFFQVVTGFFRLKDPRKRKFQIFTHWLLGVFEYLLAVVCMIDSSFILLSGMTCEGVIALGFLLVFQMMFYASMEVHMRNVDKLLKLKPKRSYLPPPIMRVFDKDAPDAKFRIHVLIAYGLLCVTTSITQFVAMESNVQGESCFTKSKKYQIKTIDYYFEPE